MADGGLIPAAPGTAPTQAGLVETQACDHGVTAHESSSPRSQGTVSPPTAATAGGFTLGQLESTAAGAASRRPQGRLPRFLGEYELLDEIARGGMGVVYRARQEKLNRLVAVKLIRSASLAGDDDLRRFRHEAEAIADLDHPHIIPIYEIGQEDDQPYFSMKLIEGGNLTRHIGRLKEDAAAVAALIAKVARAVHYAHQRTILHRDIKPSNILLGEHDEPYVTDFGLAKRLGPETGSAATVTGAVMGTPAYMPPEQARGGSKSVTTAADVYSLGATLYETLTGQPPFSGDSSAEIMRLVLDQEPARPRSINPKLDQDLETICLKCLAKEPAARYGSAEALAEDLERWLAGMPIVARPVPAWERVIKWVKRQRALAALVIMLLVALLGLIGGGIWFTLRLQQERDLANRGHYAADMNLARRSLEDGLRYQVREQLKDYQTGPKALADLRSFEWYYLANLCDPAPIRLHGHQKAVMCLAFHPDGSQIVSGSGDGSVRIWELSTRRPLCVLEGTGGTIRCVAVSPDGNWLAAGDERGGLRLWDLQTLRQRALAAHKSRLESVTFSPDSRHLLSCDAERRIVQWNAATGEREFHLLHGAQEEGAAPFGDIPATQEFMGPFAAYVPPNGETIVSAGMDQTVMIWDVATRRSRAKVEINNNVVGFSISPDGSQLALAEDRVGIEILDLQKPLDPRRPVPGGTKLAGTVAFAPDGRTLAVPDFYSKGVELIEVGKGRVLDLFSNRASSLPFSLAFSMNGRMLALAVGDDVEVVHLARSQNGKAIANGAGPIRRLAASPDESLLALGREDGTIIVWDVRAGRTVQTLTGHGLAVFGIAFVPRPSGWRLVSVGGDGLVKIWDPVAGGQPLLQPASGAGAAYAVAVRPVGRQIATAGEDGFVYTWDPETGRADLGPIEHGASISALAYDPAGTALASAGRDRTVRIWSATSGRRRLGPLLSQPHQIDSLAFSPNGRLIAGGGGKGMGGKILIWDAQSGKISTTVDCPRGVDCLSFSADSRRIATCGADAVVQVWDATGGHETLSLDAKGGRVSSVLFAPRELRLYSAGRDGLVKLWDGSAPGPPE
jgi:WD40 repeat protein/tRNA A-37 threonylcarbamoyl transferase component Bud32